ncbi:hypothetical protein TNIN_139971 [Trichonephila inaurata madagascariensis]|uniref:Uncharacterized protein n=1 Tax=Trichonephila inaurata madagascariensis TaxID=2747483 RepID=A0A8X6MB48_9ARAC|nr:hypothetical protein TNIN_139971 [Trichonephila inaurata madagascariensis]
MLFHPSCYVYDSYEDLEDKIQDPYLQQVEPVEESAFADNSEELLIGLQCVIYNMENSKVISVLIGDFKHISL